MRTLRRAATTALLAAAIGAMAAGCGSHASQPPARTVHVFERDFVIHASPDRLPPGRVRLVVHNGGPDRHELLVVRLTGGRLPLRHDGTTVDEEALQAATVGQVEAAEPGSTHAIAVRLRPGRYVLFCNMEGHFLGGMSRVLVVGRAS